MTTGVGAALNTAKVEPGATVAVFGAGGVGLSAIQGARIAGATRIIAVDLVEEKLGRALEMGATHVVDASNRDPVEALVEMTDGGVDHALECIGNKTAAEQCFEALGARRNGNNRGDDSLRTGRGSRRCVIPQGEEDTGMQHGLQPVSGWTCSPTSTTTGRAS